LVMVVFLGPSQRATFAVHPLHKGQLARRELNPVCT
jgi:hypothetical protein